MYGQTWWRICKREQPEYEEVVVAGAHAYTK